KMKARQKDIKKDLSGYRNRFEAYWRQEKIWHYKDWEKYIHQSELLRYISKLLIWTFENDSEKMIVYSFDNQFVNYLGEIQQIPRDTQVRLWHPIESNPQEVLYWRQFLLQREIQQPIKQAFREVYLLTEAEKQSSPHSYRFANHVLWHHKMKALAQLRLWNYESVYTHDPPTLDFVDLQIKAQLDLKKDQDFVQLGGLHFLNPNTQQNLPLAQVVPRIFSETLRDLDLFVGQCSIGQEPDWQEQRYLEYWENYSKSTLSEMAQSRRLVLENMIPKLKIKDQCHIDKKFLWVRGKIKTYKIKGSLISSSFASKSALLIMTDKVISASKGRKIFSWGWPLDRE
ncbi:MAG: DUF4132 domain-containing protein, partial [Bacteroidota bacterium]